jgi:2,3,4,5-tetrahydropyridine-2-carboxylate N-succinyltransferase
LSTDGLRETIERLAALEAPGRDEAGEALEALWSSLERGEVRAAEPVDGGWRVNRWVKRGILLAFRCGRDRSVEIPPVFHFRDRDSLPTWSPNRDASGVRIVPGGSAVRRGAFLGRGVVIMPPAYVNVGAYVGAGSMVDSHALVGSCAQVGRDVHLSAAVQIGGVLEPVGALPVIIEDRVFVGGGCGIYEGARVRSGAVLAPGVVLTRAVPLYDLVRDEIHRAAPGEPLVVPENAVVVPGSRPAGSTGPGTGPVHLQTPVVVKYRDATTSSALALEEALR